MNMHPIASVARDTGINKDTLRVWERRYGFPVPLRDGQGERSYTDRDVEQLALVKRLMDAGHRPGRLMAMTHDERAQLALSSASDLRVSASKPVPAALGECIKRVQRLDNVGLRQELARHAAAMGLASFLNDLLAPLNEAIGEAWLAGDLAIYQEHMYTACVQATLHQALGNLPAVVARARPRVLLATLPGEPHGIGLLMAEVALALEGANCLPLGLQAPTQEITKAARAFSADIVALSVSGCTSPNQTVGDLLELRAALPAEAAIWAGGAAVGQRRRKTEGVNWIDDLAALPLEVGRWRAERIARSAKPNP